MLSYKQVKCLTDVALQQREAVIDTPPSDYVSFREAIAYIRGLETALKLLKDLEKRGDDDEQ